MLGLMPQNKKISSIILGSGNKLEEGPEVGKSLDPALDSVATKLIAAFESKDKASLISGLKEFMDVIQMMDEEQDEQGEME